MNNRILIALGAFVIWIAITFEPQVVGDQVDRPLLDIVSHGVNWGIAAATAFMLAVVFLFRWNDIGLVAPRPARSLLLMWFPLLYVVLFLVFAAIRSLPPTSVIGLLLLNTLLVGISEELMFRGVLFRALRTSLQIWPAIILTSLAFGGVHLLNVFITGDLTGAALQALTAALSSLVFFAILLRTGSIIPAIVYHMLWDFSTLLIAAGQSDVAPVAVSSVPQFVPVLLVLPNVLVALFLLRNVGKDPALAAPGAGSTAPSAG
jgi:membrane protease YdiL (CAAX protease family)